MVKNKYNQKNRYKPIESHQTAAWANIEKTENVSRVPIPSEFQVENAKKWVEENQK